MLLAMAERRLGVGLTKTDTLDVLVFKPHSGETDHDKSTVYTPDAVLVAIDITKVRNEVLIETSHHKRRRCLSVLTINTRAEHDRLIETLSACNSVQFIFRAPI
jgi:hypothetical protein